MADNEILVAAMSTLTAAIRELLVATVTPKVYNPFKSTDSFNLSSRLGSVEYKTISAPLNEI